MFFKLGNVKTRGFSGWDILGVEVLTLASLKDTDLSIGKHKDRKRPLSALCRL